MAGFDRDLLHGPFRLALLARSFRLDMAETCAEDAESLTELVEQLNVEAARTASTDNVKNDAHSENYDDFWCEDEDIDDVLNGNFSHTSVMNREWKWRHDQFHTMGYRDGITAGKEASAQEGFNAGFKQSMHAGYKWGLGRGISSTLASLPVQLKEKLMGTPENRLRSLHESLQAISTRDALKMYHETIQETTTGCNQLEGFFNELRLFIDEAPEVKVNAEFGQRVGLASS